MHVHTLHALQVFSVCGYKTSALKSTLLKLNEIIMDFHSKFYEGKQKIDHDNFILKYLLENYTCKGERNEWAMSNKYWLQFVRTGVLGITRKKIDPVSKHCYVTLLLMQQNRDACTKSIKIPAQKAKGYEFC